MNIKNDDRKGFEYLNCECPICGKKFHLKPYSIKKFKTHCCSKECANKLKSQYMVGEGNHQYGLSHEKNASYKHIDKKINKFGYVKVRDYSHPLSDKDGWILEHRVIAEKYLLNDENSFIVNDKQYLKPEYDVHHKNFDRTDNRVENLEVLTRSDHRRLHCTLNPMPRDKKTGRFVKEPNFIKCKRITKTAIIPKRKTTGAAAYDLSADILEPITVNPNETVTIFSGLAFEIPNGYFGAIYARSGLSIREGLRPATCVSVIDSDYRGNVGLPIHNDSAIPRIINPKDRIAQIVFQKALIVDIEEVDKLDETERGSNGFGSTGR